MCEPCFFFTVIPAKAGIQLPWLEAEKKLDSRLRGNDLR
jgi:hypothetical protein